MLGSCGLGWVVGYGLVVFCGMLFFLECWCFCFVFVVVFGLFVVCCVFVGCVGLLVVVGCCWF